MKKLSPSIIKLQDLIEILEENTFEYIENSKLHVRLKFKVSSEVNVKKTLLSYVGTS